ncbi:2-hydroxy-6-oxononadienedioate/2-hydroxy-6-oxononatrienedioate hydrolase [Peribacillus sp. Bi96]|uniref:alpha/beta fold hydrolase n=1 Tax=Peribacillus sp. Bi96 TaxID=2884273 RepID=UPI001D1B4299|nr:alpha/beta hydrolase [Peribacillus sp. Bi96]CAH0254297.1 2-hydroxy-6-oxononadienedioate/2-hydroxy-6-oxononatrienedioate hydrolase [Peribacillus sp. Bi96]
MESQKIKGVERVNNIEIYFEHDQIDDSFPTLVLLHGFLSSSFSFRKLVPYLTKEFNVISLDLPPFGQSGKDYRYTYSFRNMANSVVQFLKEKDIRAFSIIGHSMGGQISLQLIKSHPDLVEHAILLAGSGYQPSYSEKMKMVSYLPFFSFGIKRYLQKSGIEKNLKNVVHDPAMIDDEMRQGYLGPFIKKHDIFRALGRMLRDKEIDLLKEELADIHTPCLLIWGRHDRVVPVNIGQRLHDDLPNSELVVLEDSGHLLPEEKPEEVYRLIKGFLGVAK